MNRILLILALATIGFGSFAQKNVYVDTKYILSKIPEFKEAQRQLDELSEKWQKEVETKFANVSKKKSEYGKDKPLLTDVMRKKREDEIVSLEVDAKKLQQDIFGVKGKLFSKRQELIEPIQNKIYNAIKEMAASNDYAFVFDKANQSNILYARPKDNKSDRVLKLMGYRP